MTFLEDILKSKREEIAERKRSVPVEKLRASPQVKRPTVSLRQALGRRGFGIIAEVKKASPSRGVIREDFDPVALARSYARHGAAALSVLTDEPFFQGKLHYLTQIRAAVDIPVLRKDFIIDEYQILESRAAGADAVLLIAAALDQKTLEHLSASAREHGLEILLEIHTAGELQRTADVPCDIVGVNNRDLHTFVTDLTTSRHLRPLMKPNTVCISESGIRSAEDLFQLRSCGYHGALIGETFMRMPDPGEGVGTLIRALENDA